MVEGNLDGVWKPARGVNLIAKDAQGNDIQCETGLLPFGIFTDRVYMHNTGVFGIPIPSTLIGSGSPGDTETITVVSANGLLLAPSNSQSITCQVVPYNYTEEWGYRLYAKGGAGVTGGIATATAFGGGGSGVTVAMDLEGLDPNPNHTAFRIHRRDDFFAGVDAELGPPCLIEVDKVKVAAQASFPYEVVYDFDLDNLDGLESLMAFYLIAEPTILYANSASVVSNLTVRFLSLCFRALVNNNAVNGLGIARISDEAGLDIQGSVDLNVDVLAHIPLGLKMGPSLGAKAHLGSSTKLLPSGEKQNRIFLGGEFETRTNIGPKMVPGFGASSKFFYPRSINDRIFPRVRNVEYEFIHNWDSQLNWESLTLSSKVGSTDPNFRMFDLPGQMEEQKSWLKIEDAALKNYCQQELNTPADLWGIGTAPVYVQANNETMSQDMGNLLNYIYQKQSSNLPVKAKYGFECEDKSSFEFKMDLKFPLIGFPGIVIKLGMGLDATNSRNYHVADGYWVKGYPYFQNMMSNPPDNNIEIGDIIGILWNGITHGDLASELVDLIVTEFRHRVLNRLPWRSQMMETLNDNGSYITLTENSFPTDADSVVFRNWDWGEEPQDNKLNQRQLETVKRYNKQLREIRERAAGMHYGIGGFYRFEAEAEGWNEAPQLTIKYLDSELDGIDESTLKMYWEDEYGDWHLLNSTAVPDSNLVRANIPYFTTYTLAPNLPHGEIGLSATPDSLLADGSASAQVFSGTLYNNDGSIVADGTQYTVLVNRGQLLDADADPELTGLQVVSLGGCLQFTVQADSIPVPIEITVTSVDGYSSGFLSLPLYAAALPSTPILLDIQAEHRTLHLNWQELNEPGIIGYRIYYDTDTAGPPYNGTSSEETQNSPVTVGNIGSYTLTGLDNSQAYHIVITALDAYGNESHYSNEMLGQPVLKAITNLAIANEDTGIRLSWTPASGATSYKVYRSPQPLQDISQMQYLGETTDPWWIDQTAGSDIQNFYLIISIGY
ncbi:MAG TPA: hypothetical protein DCQ12_07335 [Candidatus Cloacimonas sp.]|nr:hypothetical protein [Candidatus Cloacimonas sp.]